MTRGAQARAHQQRHQRLDQRRLAGADRTADADPFSHRAVPCRGGDAHRLSAREQARLRRFVAHRRDVVQRRNERRGSRRRRRTPEASAAMTGRRSVQQSPARRGARRPAGASAACSTPSAESSSSRRDHALGVRDAQRGADDAERDRLRARARSVFTADAYSRRNGASTCGEPRRAAGGPWRSEPRAAQTRPWCAQARSASITDATS